MIIIHITTSKTSDLLSIVLIPYERMPGVCVCVCRWGLWGSDTSSTMSFTCTQTDMAGWGVIVRVAAMDVVGARRLYRFTTCPQEHGQVLGARPRGALMHEDRAPLPPALKPKPINDNALVTSLGPFILYITWCRTLFSVAVTIEVSTWFGKSKVNIDPAQHWRIHWPFLVNPRR